LPVFAVTEKRELRGYPRQRKRQNACYKEGAWRGRGEAFVKRSLDHIGGLSNPSVAETRVIEVVGG